jgi:hypothetical protein
LPVEAGPRPKRAEEPIDGKEEVKRPVDMVQDQLAAATTHPRHSFERH